jgi:hypothetical protein
MLPAMFAAMRILALSVVLVFRDVINSCPRVSFLSLGEYGIQII